MVTFTINIPQMLAYIPAPWIRHGLCGYHCHSRNGVTLLTAIEVTCHRCWIEVIAIPWPFWKVYRYHFEVKINPWKWNDQTIKIDIYKISYRYHIYIYNWYFGLSTVATSCCPCHLLTWKNNFYGQQLWNNWWLADEPNAAKNVLWTPWVAANTRTFQWKKCVIAVATKFA